MTVFIIMIYALFAALVFAIGPNEPNPFILFKHSREKKHKLFLRSIFWPYFGIIHLIRKCNQ